MLKASIVIVLSGLASLLQAQECSKIYSIANLNGSSVHLRAMWVSDSNNFNVLPLCALPKMVSDNGTIDFQVQLLPRDGIMHSTEVYYQTDLGVSSYTISMTAPLMLSGAAATVTTPHDKHAYPNPANTQCSIDLDTRLYPNVQVDLVNEAGVRVIGIAQLRGDKLVLDTHTLGSGRYMLMVSSSGTPIHNEEIVVRH